MVSGDFLMRVFLAFSFVAGLDEQHCKDQGEDHDEPNSLEGRLATDKTSLLIPEITRVRDIRVV